MRDVTDAPFFLRLGSRMRGPEGVPVGTIKRVTISNIVSSGSHPKVSALISGIPGHPIEDLRLSNIHIHHQGGGTAEQAGLVLPEKENAYPEPTMFGDTPSQGIYFRHVKGLQANDIKITSEKEDARPGFVLHAVESAGFFHIAAPGAPSGETFALNDVTNFSLTGSRPLADAIIDHVEKRSL